MAVVIFSCGNMFNGFKQKIKKHFTKKWQIYLWSLAFVVVLLIGIWIGYFYAQETLSPVPTSSEKPKDEYISFLFEVYDKIQENYWNKLTDEQLGGLFKSGIETIAGKPQNIEIKTKQDFEKMLEDIFKIVKPDKKKLFTTQLASIVLTSLPPKNRSTLYTVQKKEELRNMVQNINPENDLYQNLGISKDASKEELEKAYKEKVAELEEKTEESEEAKKDLEKVKYSYEVLKDENKKQRYDKAGIEPTILSKLVRPNILHLYIKRISPTTFNELQEETQKYVNKPGLDTLILDLRSNIGGSIDLLPYLLGPFIGNEQYAYEFLHQGEKTPYKTKVGWLPSLYQYKKVIILTDNKTQSSAEVMAAVLKKYNVGILVGTTTRGWGTIETVLDLNQTLEGEKYSLLLVHSLTLRDDNQIIEGNGVEPLININNSNWKEELRKYFDSEEIIKAVEEIWNTPPGTI